MPEDRGVSDPQIIAHSLPVTDMLVPVRYRTAVFESTEHRLSPLMNLYQRIFEQPIRPDASSAVAVVDVAKDGRQVSYAQLKRLVDNNRSTIPIEAGEKVALVMPNSLELIVGLLATWAQGGATAPLNPAYTSSEFRELFEDLSVNTALIVPGDDNIRNVLRAASRDLNIVEVDLSQLETTSMEPPPVDKGNSVALYLHTSGTTGKPKAVPLRHSNLLRGASNVAEAYALSRGDRTYLLQVLFHIHGIVAALLAPLITGGSIVIPPGGKLNASRAWFDFNDYSCTWVTGTPSILQTLLAAPCPERIPDIRFIRSCSSPLLPTVFDALRKRFGCPIIEAYAMTEASHQMCSNRLDLFSPGTVGPESGGAKICIWDGGDRARDLGAEGEVCVAGENVFGGYEGVSPEKNTEAFWYGADERGNQAKWFRTGDRGVLSTDGHRRLTLIGRLSEMVNRGGEKISPVEVDEALMLTSEDIKEAASFSVKDEFYGQEIEAAVVLVDGSRLSEGQIQHLLEQRLAQFKVPKRIHFCEGAIPKGPTGKIQRKNLTLLYDNSNKAKAHTNTALPANDIYRIIDESLSLQPGTSQARPNVTLLALGADSMGLASIVASVRKLTGKTIPMAELFSFPPVDRVVEMVSQADATRSSGEAETFQKPEAFSLLNISHESLQECCSEAGIKTDDLEDAFPLSAVQAAFWLRVIGEGTDHNLGWKISRYQLAETVDRERLLQALTTLERYEESLRWTFAKPADSDWVTLQTRPGVESRVHEIHANTDGEATQELERRFSSFAHHSGVRTSHMFVMSSDSGLELAFIESHVCSEAVSRNMIIENLQKLYDNEVPDSHAPYALFVQKYPAGNDSRQAREFWQNELEALWYSEKPDWNLKKRCLVHPPELSDSRLTLAGVKQSVEGPFQQLSVHVGMTLPLTVESVFALSLAIYFGQQDSAFTRGHLAYDRGMSLRAPESGFHDLRSLTLSFHPSLPLTDLAKQSLWTFMQHYKSMTELRQQNACLDVKSIPDNYAISYLWRFEDPSTTPCRLISEVKKESFEMRTYKTCLTTASRNGPNGVTFGIGFQPKWLEDQRRSGSKVELIDVCCRALRFISIRHTDLARLNFEDLRKAVMGGDC